jgi:hypothetical protein
LPYTNAVRGGIYPKILSKSYKPFKALILKATRNQKPLTSDFRVLLFMVPSNFKRIKNKRLHNPTVRLKVPSGLLAKAVHDKKKTPLLYYYAAKSLKADGSFKRVELINGLMLQRSRSRSTVKENINRLVACGWLLKSSNGYQLVSYNHVWAELGIDLNNEHLGLLTFAPCSKIEETIISKELALLQKKQAKKIEKNIILKTFPKDCTDLKLLGKAKLRMVRKVALSDQNVASLKEAEQKALRTISGEKGFTDNAITCKRFAAISGRTSSRTGWRMEQKLKAAGLVTIENRKIKLEDKFADIYQFRQAGLDLSYWFFKGYAYKQMPNKITVL